MSGRIKVYIIEQRGRPYAAQWTDPATGLRKTRTLDTRDGPAAETAAADLEYKLNHGIPVGRPGKAPGTSWEEFRAIYARERFGALRPDTRKKTASVFAVVEELLAPRLLSDLTDAALSRLVLAMQSRQGRGGKRFSPFTVAGHLGHLRAALRWAAERSPPLLPAVPRFPKVRVPEARPVPPAMSDVARLVEAARGQWRPYLLLALWAGLRLREAFELRWSASEDWPWVDLERSRLWIPRDFAKGRADQWVPLHPGLKEELTALPREGERVFHLVGNSGRPLTCKSASAAVVEIARQAGVRMSMQKLRRAFGCNLAGRVSADVLRILMRHKNLQTTLQFYAVASNAVLTEAIEGLE